MKLQVMLVLAVAATAGPAAAGDYGSWAPNAHKPRAIERQGFVPLPSAPAPSTSRHSAGTAPEAPGFKPYRGQSVYSHPKGYGASPGAKDCELSIYVNACGRKR